MGAVKVDVVTIFPEYLAPLDLSLIGRARAAGLLELAVHDLRQWTHDVHRTVDDTPYGGGPGMVMRPEPWGSALDALDDGHLIVPSPAGVAFNPARAHELAAGVTRPCCARPRAGPTCWPRCPRARWTNTTERYSRRVGFRSPPPIWQSSGVAATGRGAQPVLHLRGRARRGTP